MDILFIIGHALIIILGVFLGVIYERKKHSKLHAFPFKNVHLDVFEPIKTSKPDNPIVGEAYYNGSDDTFYYYNGEQWIKK